MANNKILSPALPLAIFVFLSLAALANAQTRKPLIYGITEKPFPLISNLEYPLCRALAWLDALRMGVDNLPAPLLGRLRTAGFATPLAREALAALLCPLDVVTPQNADSARIRVFLKWPDEPLQAGLAILDKPALLRMEMAFIYEMRQAAIELHTLWPASVASGQNNLGRMEALANALDELWKACIFNSNELDGKAMPWTTAFQKNTDVPSLALASATALPPLSTSALDKALARLLAREASPDGETDLWNWLSAKALFLRGCIHARRDATALAEADFKAALIRLQKTDADSQLLARTWQNLGRIYKERGEQEKMCAAFEAACAQGSCQDLSFARRSQLCLSAPK